MSANTEFTRPDGKSCPGYLSEPQGPGPHPGFVLLQEWWGLNPQMCKMADRLAAEGYRVLVPDLFRGTIAADAAEANHLMTNLDFSDASGQDVQGAVARLREKSSKCGVGGFCMGGALTIFAALGVEGVDAGVCFYGIPPAEYADPGKIRIPMLYHFAQQDDWCTPALVDALEASVKKSGSAYELYRYDAHHAFMNEARPEVYDAACAAKAWERSLQFLRRTLA